MALRPSKQVRLTLPAHRAAVRCAALRAMLDGRESRSQRHGAAPRGTLTETVCEALRTYTWALERRAERSLAPGWRLALKARVESLSAREPTDPLERTLAPGEAPYPVVRPSIDLG